MRRWFKHIAVGVGLLVVIAALWVIRYPMHELPLKNLPLQFSINSGSTLRGATQQMVQARVLDRALPFEVMTRLLGEPTAIKAGNYELDKRLTPLELMHKITRGDYTSVAITFVEGWTFRQMRQALDNHSALKHDSKGLPDAELLQRLGIPQTSPEGWFFPDTYHFSNGASDLTVLRRAYQLMQKHLTAQWENRAPDLPLQTPYEALILASIVEKETGHMPDRSVVSAVFNNRLKVGMKLQTDPTIIYGLGEKFDGNLRKQDLVTDGPYNTYTRPGMPPTPIAMPGLASLRAALHPASTDALYFVARGDGSSEFSRTFEEHDRAVTKYQRGGKK